MAPAEAGAALGADADRLRRRLGVAEAELASLSAEILECYEEAALVHGLCGRLGTVLGERHIAATVLEDAVRTLAAERGAVWLRDGDGVRLAATVPDDGGPLAPADAPGASDALASGRACLREPASGGAVVAVPLPGGDGRPLGVLALCGRRDGRAYRTGDVKVLESIATLTAAFVRNDRMASAARDAAARRREDEIARQIHAGLLPAQDPTFDGIDVAAACRAADSIGGDYYGYLLLRDGSLAIAIADVSGHGVGAALYMASTKGALQSEARHEESPSELLRLANDTLSADFGRSDVFATAAIVCVRPGGRQLRYSNGGHNPPLVFRRDGAVDRLDSGGPALGVLPGLRYAEAEIRLDPGELLVLYTDGIVEARCEHRGFYGLDRLIDTVRSAGDAPPGEVRDLVLRDFVEHCGSEEPGDDATLVVVRAERSATT